MTSLHAWITSVRKKFQLHLEDKSRGYWQGYSDAIDDVQDFADRLEHDPTGACLLKDKNHEGDHVV